MLNDYHTHLESGPYTADWGREYVQAARHKGLDEIGFSEHAYRFRQARHLLSTRWAMHFDHDIDDYVGAVRQLQREGLPVRLGIEMDYIAMHEEDIRRFLESIEWDYVIGSVHWLQDWGFDLPSFKHEWDERDVTDTYFDYYETLQMAIRSGLFDVIGHYDLIKIFGHRPPEYIDFEPVHQSTLRLMKDHDQVFEINTSGLRKPVGEIYPSEDILQILGRLDLPVTISSDAHHPEQIAQDFNQALQLVQRYGIRRFVRFERRERHDIAF